MAFVHCTNGFAYGGFFVSERICVTKHISFDQALNVS